MTGIYIAISAAACFAVGTIAAYLKGRVTLLPDSLVDEMGSDVKYVCRCCTSDNLREACDLTRPLYGHEYVAADVALRWLKKNPLSFVEMLNGDEVLCACFAILPLEDSFMGQFIKGRLDDHQIDGDDVLDAVKAKTCKRLYISGVIVRDHLGFVGRKRANVMIWAMLNYIRVIYGLKRQRTLYAVSVTKESERLMKNLGFSMISDGAGRKDHCKLFSYLLCKASWDRMHVTVGDWSGICECRFK